MKKFLANYNNAARPGGGDGVLDLDSGVFTCVTPGYYSVSFSVYSVIGPTYAGHHLYLYTNGMQLPESYWYSGRSSGAVNANVGVTGSRILVGNLFSVLQKRCKV